MDWFTRIAPIRQKMAIVVMTMVGAAAAATLVVLVAALAGYPWVGAAGGVGITLAVAAIGSAMKKGVVDPYVATVVRMEGLAAGDLSAPIQHTDFEDCVGRMTKAMFTFRDTAVSNNEQSAAQAAVVTLLGRHLAELRQGDLTTRIEADMPGEYAVLKNNFNDAVVAIRALIAAVAESAAAIRTGSGEIAQASEDLARRTENNAASLEETTTAVAQMDDRLKASVTAAKRTVERADQAIATVGGGRAVADEAVQAMGRVSDSAKGIDSVIEGLDKIAFQTRVLAMNAAVEAGRAGDAGRGFAVVADLVSALAMRAEEEAKRARDQLTVTQTDIVTAVEAVTKVDGALANISGDVGQVHELLASMAADNLAQSGAITEISATIGAMDQATQQNAAMVEETSAAARNLAGEVDNLAEQASRFTIGQPGAGRRPASAPRASVAHTIAYASPVRPLPAAAIPAMVRGDDDWNEF